MNQPQQIPLLLWLLQSGGLTFLGLSLLVSLVALYLIARPSLHGCIVLLCLLTLPSFYALYAVYSAAVELQTLAASSSTPKPAQFAVLIGRALSAGFYGVLGTLLPTVLAAIALMRSVPRSIEP